ncbi:MAG: TlpA disulfide reductase family protein [Bacteroidota bacterium]|nr:TlpA disulfide reductase family protein [Bacteroidota bacterium]
MDPTLVYLMGTAMIVVGLVFLRMLQAGRKPDTPRDFMEWAGTILSVLLIVTAVTLMVIGRGSDPEIAEIRQQVATAGSYQDVKIAVPAPEFEFTHVDTAAPDQLSNYAGKVVVINFWATWCAPCLDEIPDLNRLQREYPEDLTIISISDEAPGLLQAFEQQLALDTESRYVSFGKELPQPFTGAFVIRPATFVLDREGVVRRYLLGARDYDFFKGVIDPLIASQPADEAGADTEAG